MAPVRSRRHEPCAHEDCGSRRFHVGDDGFTYCDQGHQQSERGTVIAEDTGELANLGRKSRKRDSDAESIASKSSKGAGGFSGARAFDHYLLCIQLVLRKQLRWLIDVQKLPGELETLVRDLWALRLQKLQYKVAHESDTETEAPSSQVFSSQSEAGSGSASQSSRRSRKRDAGPKEGTPNLLETLTFCYIGTLLLRIPLTVADLHEWTKNGELLYYRVSHEVPLSMTKRLPGRYQRLLEPQELLQPQSLHQNVLKMLTLLDKEFGMTMPVLNTPLVLFRWAKEFLLPLEVFVATQRLAGLLEYHGDFVGPAATSANVVLRYPEARLMALLVVATKLLFQSDGMARQVQSGSDLSALSMDWQVWSKLMEKNTDQTDKHSWLTFEEGFDFNESDCLGGAEDRLDAYLYWCEKNIAQDEIRERGRARDDAEFRKDLFRMFPTQSPQSSRTEKQTLPAKVSTDERLGRMQSSLSTTPIEKVATASDSNHKPGSFYRRFRRVDELAGPMKILFERAAMLAGLPPESMVQAVFLTERQMQKYEEKLRKSAKSA